MRLVFLRHMYQALVAGLIALTSATLLVAQSTTDGAIGGTVFDSTGAVISRAQVTVHNNGTNAEHTATTDEAGYFRVATLQPGAYTVTVSRQGFAPFKAEAVIVQVGSLTEVSPRLKAGGGEQTIEVTAQAPQINYTSPEFAPTLDQTAISNLPINGGRWSSFAVLTPGVVNDSNGFGLLSFRGISTLLNNNTVDGADNNQAFFSEERGRTRIGYSTPKAAVQEFQVNTSNYSAEYGRSAGGVVNTATKSGTNVIHGEGYFYDRDNDIGAFNEFTQINVQTSPGVFVSQPLKPTDKRQMAGFGVGGPLIKDKLFLFVAYDWYHHNFPGVAITGNPNAFFAPPSAVTITTFAQRLTGNATPTPTDIANATATYNSDLTALNTLLGTVPRTGDQNILFPKVDWQVNSKNHASFSFNRMRWSSPAGIQTGSAVTRGIASFGNDYVKDTWGVAKLDTSITTSVVNELRFQYGRDFEFEFSQPPAPYELTNLVNSPTFTNPLGLPPSVSITNGFTFGVPNFLQRPFFPDESRAQGADTLSWTHGNHAFKFGIDVSHVNDNSQNLFNGFGSYSYGVSTPATGSNSLLNYFSDLNKPNSCGGPCYSSFSQGLGLPGLEFTTNDLAFFAADDWKIRRRLSISLGLRYERQLLPSPVASLINPAFPQTGQMPDNATNFGPRVGFAWDVLGDSKTVLRGGYGIYYGRIINSTIFNALIVTGMPGSQVSVSFQPTSAGAPTFPAILTNPNAASIKRSVDFFDPNFRNPQIHQMDLTLERDLGWGTVFSMSYLGSLGRRLPDFVDTNICTAVSVPAPTCTTPRTITYTVLGGGPLQATTFTEPLYSQRANPTFGSVTDILSGTNSSYHAMVVQLTHRMRNNLQFSANYTWSHAIDFGQNQSTFSDTNDFLFPASVPNAIAFEKGNSIYDVPNRFVVHAVATTPWKKAGWVGWLANDWQMDPIFQIQNGLPLNLTTGGSPGIVTGVSGVNASLFGGVGSGINGSGGANRLELIGRNTFRLPTTWVGDVRLAKYLTVQEKYKLELLADFFNLANKQNITQENNTGYNISNPSISKTTNLVTSCAQAAGVPITSSCLTFNGLFSTFNNSNNNFAYSPRQIQLGLRVLF